MNLYKPPIIIFVYKKVLDNTLKYAFDITDKSKYGFNNDLEHIFGTKLFAFPLPGTPCKKCDADKYMIELIDFLNK